MKKEKPSLKRFVHGVIAALSVAVILVSSGAPPVARSDDHVPPAKELRLNPETLRKQLLENNLSIIQALNQVHDAKDQVSVARGNLLPSLNLGALLNPAQ